MGRGRWLSRLTFSRSSTTIPYPSSTCRIRSKKLLYSMAHRAKTARVRTAGILPAVKVPVDSSRPRSGR